MVATEAASTTATMMQTVATSIPRHLPRPPLITVRRHPIPLPAAIHARMPSMTAAIAAGALVRTSTSVIARVRLRRSRTNATRATAGRRLARKCATAVIRRHTKVRRPSPQSNGPDYIQVVLSRALFVCQVQVQEL